MQSAQAHPHYYLSGSYKGQGLCHRGTKPPQPSVKYSIASPPCVRIELFTSLRRQLKRARLYVFISWLKDVFFEENLVQVKRTKQFWGEMLRTPSYIDWHRYGPCCGVWQGRTKMPNFVCFCACNCFCQSPQPTFVVRSLLWYEWCSVSYCPANWWAFLFSFL